MHSERLQNTKGENAEGKALRHHKRKERKKTPKTAYIRGISTRVQLIHDSVQPCILFVDLTNKVVDSVAVLENNEYQQNSQQNSLTFHSLRIPSR